MILLCQKKISIRINERTMYARILAKNEAPNIFPNDTFIVE